MSVESARMSTALIVPSANGGTGRLRALLSPSRLVRYPVSVARRRMGKAVLALLLLSLGWYWLNTRDEAIRRWAIEFVEEAMPGGVDVSVGWASFRMFKGITLHDVRISVPYDERLDPQAFDPEQRRIFSARTLRLVHNPWRLLFGGLRVERVVAVEPTIVLTQNVDTGLRNWQVFAEAAKDENLPSPETRPIITLRSVQAVVASINERGERQETIERLDADVRPHPQNRSGYNIEVRRYSEPPERTTVYFDVGGAWMVANTPFVDARTVRLQLPRPAHDLFEDIDLRGEVQLTRMLYDAKKRQDFDSEISLRNVRCRIPFSLLRSQEERRRLSELEAKPSQSQDESALTMTGVHGVVRMASDRLYVEVAGLINGATCTLSGELEEVSRGLDDAGVKLRFEGAGIPTPEGAIRKRMLTDEGIPWVVRKYFIDYDPHGNLDFDMKFDRPAGPEHDLLVTGEVSFKGIKATCRWFEYLLEDVHGRLRFERDFVYLDNLHGRHGSGQAAINVVFDARKFWSDIDVDIRASAIPLDPALYDALPEHYQAAWSRFTPRGTANIHAHLHRPGGTEDEPKPRWQKRIVIDLTDAQAWMAPYPHPLEHVFGRLDVEEERIRIDGLTGMSRGGSVRVDGYTILTPERGPEVELRVEARRMKLDKSFGSALPPEGRGAFEQFEAEGFVDVVGSVSLHGASRGLVWDLRTRVFDTSICYEHFPFRIDDVEGEIAIRPDRLSIIQAKGRHDETEIAVGGQVERRENGFTADIVLDTRRIRLTEELFRALPPELQEVWELLDPAGEVRVRTRLYFASEDGRRIQRHRTEIEPMDAHVRFRGFPLDLTSVIGKVFVTNRRVEILSLRGYHGDGMVELRGEIGLGAPAPRGTLVLAASRMDFTDELVSAMPDGLRAFFEPINPQGRFDLHLDPLRFATIADGGKQWDFDGRIELDEFEGDFGFRVSDGKGSVSGRGGFDEDGRINLDLSARMEKAKLSDWHVENLTARIHTNAAASQILIEDASADLYGGDAIGFAEVDIGEGPSDYQASFTIRDVQLGSYLETHESQDSKPSGEFEGERARGTISGHFALRGRPGKGGYREGAGEMFVAEAQVWKLPIFLAIFQVLNLSPDENVFHDGRLKMFLSGQRLTFQNIDLQGKAMSFIGGGALDLQNDQLNVTLLARSPVRIKLPLLTDILQGASREIMEVKVTGTLTEPRITPQPLKSLKTALETLFPDAPEPIRRRPISSPRE